MPVGPNLLANANVDDFEHQSWGPSESSPINVPPVYFSEKSGERTPKTDNLSEELLMQEGGLNLAQYAMLMQQEDSGMPEHPQQFYALQGGHLLHSGDECSLPCGGWRLHM
jgi:hypothetical protein